MIAYLDTSVLIRVLLREENPLPQWHEIDLGITSEITRVECYRTIDRLRLVDVIDDDQYAAKLAEVEDLWSRIDVVRLRKMTLHRASGSFPTVIGTLDAIHLVGAMTCRERQPRDQPPIYLATHDKGLASCARATGFPVIGA